MLLPASNALPGFHFAWPEAMPMAKNMAQLARFSPRNLAASADPTAITNSTGIRGPARPPNPTTPTGSAPNWSAGSFSWP